MQRAYRSSTVLLGSALALLGVAVMVTTLTGGGGPLATRFVLGAMLALLGAGRVYLARK
jgi:hypothetical protein